MKDGGRRSRRRTRCHHPAAPRRCMGPLSAVRLIVVNGRITTISDYYECPWIVQGNGAR